MTHDPWEFLRRHTSARIALGRSGGSIKTAELLDFRLAHARARDAVHSPFDAEGLAAALRALGLDTRVVRTRARDRQEYLLRPDLGRALDDASRTELAAPRRGFDLALVASDGLSAEAMRRNAIPFFTALVPLARQLGLTLSPAVVVSCGRVAVQDEIGQLLGARIALIALGERPGLGSADSLGLYFVHDPRPGRTDAERNCISNVREGGLAPAAAARKALYLIRQALELKLSGVALKDDGGALLPPSE